MIERLDLLLGKISKLKIQLIKTLMALNLASLPFTMFYNLLSIDSLATEKHTSTHQQELDSFSAKVSSDASKLSGLEDKLTSDAVLEMTMEKLKNKV